MVFFKRLQHLMDHIQNQLINVTLNDICPYILHLNMFK